MILTFRRGFKVKIWEGGQDAQNKKKTHLIKK